MTAVSALPHVPLLAVDTERWETHVLGLPVHLTKIEFLILSALYDAQGRVLTREILADRVGVYPGASRALDVHLCRLRRKLGPAAHLILTIRGVGWRLR